MAAPAAAEAEVEANKAAQDKPLPAPPVPSRRLLGAQEIFKDYTADTPTDVPRTPSLSALSLLRPPQRHDQQPLPKQQEDGLDALERRLVEQVGTRRIVPPPAAAQAADPPPAPVPLPIAVSRAEVPNGGAEMNESAISSLALGAEESFGGRNGNGHGAAAATEDLDAELEMDDLLDARTQRLSKGGATAGGGGGGGGGSSGSERGTHKARSRKSFKSDRDRGKEREEKKAMRKKRDGGRDEEAVRMKRAAKGRVAEWLEKLASPEQGQGDPEPDLPILPEPPAAEAQADEELPPVTPPESKPNPRSSGFISVTTLRRAPITLPKPAD